eukprot:TRINITY_DN6508_c0_g1_i6.p1 TRINITY_DN6508_c0_g1~~TRINITY_DN6508_c0_g1_i6.p1  ORF type:complete len:198 (-),score=42.12 TRINITY_DN6508_c0_g1_i6:317-910(-)
MCGGPLVTSVCGLSLKKAVIAVGIGQMVITVIATILNIIKYERGYDRSECSPDDDVCIGPLIKYSVFDASFGILTALLLIFGALRKNICLLIFWMIIIPFTCIKYLWVVITHDWTQFEDYISLTYLLFYLSVFVVVWSLYREIQTKPLNHTPQNVQATLVVNYPPQQPQGYPQQYAPVQQQQQQFQPQAPPPYNPQY